MNDDTLKVVRVTSSAKKHTRRRENRGRQNRDRRGERSELEEQHKKDQHDREHQHGRQIAERLLLFLVGAAVLDADRGRQLQVGDGLLHRRDAGAHVDALEPRGHFDEALQVLAEDFGLPGLLVDRRRASRAWPSSVRAHEHRVAHRLERAARADGEAHAQRIGAVVRQ